MRFDAEEIFNSSDILSFLGEQGIRNQTSVPFKHYQSAERADKSYISTVKSRKSSPSSLVGTGDFDLSVKFLFPFGDFVALTPPPLLPNGNSI